MKIRMILAMIFLALLVQSTAQSKPNKDDDGVSPKRNSYNTLSAYQKGILDGFINSEFPTGTKISESLTDNASLRNFTRLAEALLFRNNTDDKQNAITILQWILRYQNIDDTSKNYGIWRSSVADDRVDQNWREFIGCDLIIIYHTYKNILPAGLLKDIETGLLRAARGALKRNVSADYSNISIMSSFLMEYTGTAFKIDELKNAGLQKARDVFALYHKYNTFSEYNSPTYYGVTLVGIALWRELAFSNELKKMGKTLEKEFWHEIATFYNANLKNMPGPYFRGYGMDMQKYFSITGIWISVVLDDEKLSPMPATHGAKYNEISNIAPILHLGFAVPKNDMVSLTQFTKPRFIKRTVPNKYSGDTLKQVTAMINKDWMMGGLWGNRRVWGQIKAGTIHWKTLDNDVAWMLVPGDGRTNVRVTETKMSIYLADKTASEIDLYVYAKNLSTDYFTDKLWALPEMNLQINTNLKRISTANLEPSLFKKDFDVSEDYPHIMKVTYQIPSPWSSENPLLEITPDYKK